MQETKAVPLAHSPNSAALRLGICTRAVYAHIASGEICSYKDGKRRLIPDIELQEFVQRKFAKARKS